MSTIDYICVPNTLFHSIYYAEVLDIHPENVTHHLPVTVTLDIMSSSPEQLTNYALPLRIAWQKCTSDNIEMFQNELNRKLARDEKIDSNLIHNSCKCDANLVVEIGTHCEFIFATIQICTTFGIIFALMRICDKIRNIFTQHCQFEANVCIIYNID